MSFQSGHRYLRIVGGKPKSTRIGVVGIVGQEHESGQPDHDLATLSGRMRFCWLRRTVITELRMNIHLDAITSDSRRETIRSDLTANPRGPLCRPCSYALPFAARSPSYRLWLGTNDRNPSVSPARSEYTLKKVIKPHTTKSTSRTMHKKCLPGD